MSINFEILKPSASMEVTRIAGELKKQGPKVYPLSASDTHIPPPKSIINRLNNIPAAYSHYTNAEGIDELRTQIAHSYEGYHAADVVLGPGLKQGLYSALAALQQKTLCVLEPAWLGYEATAVLANYQTVNINTYEPDWKNKLQSTAFDVIIICSPNNPDGNVLTDVVEDAIIAACTKNNENRLIEGFTILSDSEFDSVFPIAKYNSTIWRSYYLNENKSVNMNFPENEAKRSQDLLNAYYDAGQFYWFKTATIHLLENKNSFGINKASIVLDDMEVQDIDNIEDWQIAEMKFKYLKNQKKTL